MSAFTNIVKRGFDFFMMAGTTIDWKGSKQSPGNLTEFSVVAFHHRAIVASILIALTPIGLFGNALVIVAVVVAKKLRTITNILVINLAVTDLVTCLCFPFLSAGLLSQTGSYSMHEYHLLQLPEESPLLVCTVAVRPCSP